jgi:hypothetical protein
MHTLADYDLPPYEVLKAGSSLVFNAWRRVGTRTFDFRPLDSNQGTAYPYNAVHMDFLPADGHLSFDFKKWSLRCFIQFV